jgi:hypothetical protein
MENQRGTLPTSVQAETVAAEAARATYDAARGATTTSGLDAAAVRLEELTLAADPSSLLQAELVRAFAAALADAYDLQTQRSTTPGERTGDYTDLQLRQRETELETLSTTASRLASPAGPGSSRAQRAADHASQAERRATPPGQTGPPRSLSERKPPPARREPPTEQGPRGPRPGP